MSIFLKIEVSTNLIGAKELETVLIPVSYISQIRSTSDGGTQIYVRGESTPRTCSESVDSLLSNCVVDLASYAG